MQHFQGLGGVIVLVLIGFVLSKNRSAIRWRIVIAGIALQFVIAVAVLRFDPVVQLVNWIAQVITKVISFADAGTVFIFGNLADVKGPWGFVFAVRVLPVIVFFSSLMTVLYHLGVMQRVVAAVAWVLRKALGITGAEALSAAANIFLGQTEAPLIVKPYIAGMTRSQLTTIMAGGFATIAGSVMAAYIGILGDAYGAMFGSATDGRALFAKHLLTASVMSAPAGIVFAKLMMPETEQPRSETVHALMTDERTTRNLFDAAAAGASDGLRLALNVAAMLVAFVALLAMVNYPLAALFGEQWSLQKIFGVVLTPIGYLCGVGPEDARNYSGLLGTQLIATEFVAYLDLAAHMKEHTLSPRAAQIATYALCGFCNFASIGIQIGGLSALAPDRRSDIAGLALRAMVAGALACWMTAAIASVLI